MYSFFNSSFIGSIVLFFCLFFVSKVGVGQIKVVLDVQTQESISGVHIYKKGSDFGVVSNRQGSANLSFFQPSDTLVFSHVGYFMFEQIKREIDSLIYLEPRAYLLDELVIPDLSALAMIKRAKELQLQQLSTELGFQAYYREYVLNDGEITKYADGEMAYQLKRKEKDNVYEVTPFVLQSRKFMPASEEKLDLDMLSQIDVGLLMKYNSLNALGQFLGSSQFENYEYSYAPSGIENMHRILVKPKPGIEQVLFQADILVNATSGFVHEIAYQTDTTTLKYKKVMNLLGASVYISEKTGVLKFIELKGRNHLHYGNISLSVFVENKHIKETVTFLSEVMVFSDEVQLGQQLKPYKHKSLFKGEASYQTRYWENGPTTPLGKEYDEAMSRLEESKE